MKEKQFVFCLLLSYYWLIQTSGLQLQRALGVSSTYNPGSSTIWLLWQLHPPNADIFYVKCNHSTSVTSTSELLTYDLNKTKVKSQHNLLNHARVSVQQNISSFSIILKDPTEQDAGWYICLFNTDKSQDIQGSLQLERLSDTIQYVQGIRTNFTGYDTYVSVVWTIHPPHANVQEIICLKEDARIEILRYKKQALHKWKTNQFTNFAGNLHESYFELFVISPAKTDQGEYNCSFTSNSIIRSDVALLSFQNVSGRGQDPATIASIAIPSIASIILMVIIVILCKRCSKVTHAKLPISEINVRYTDKELTDGGSQMQPLNRSGHENPDNVVQIEPHQTVKATKDDPKVKTFTEQEKDEVERQGKVSSLDEVDHSQNNIDDERASFQASLKEMQTKIGLLNEELVTKENEVVCLQKQLEQQIAAVRQYDSVIQLYRLEIGRREDTENRQKAQIREISRMLDQACHDKERVFRDKVHILANETKTRFKQEFVEDRNYNKEEVLFKAYDIILDCLSEAAKDDLSHKEKDVYPKEKESYYSTHAENDSPAEALDDLNIHASGSDSMIELKKRKTIDIKNLPGLPAENTSPPAGATHPRIDYGSSAGNLAGADTQTEKGSQVGTPTDARESPGFEENKKQGTNENDETKRTKDDK